MPKFPHYKQLNTMDFSPTFLLMVAKHYGKNYSLQYLRSRFTLPVKEYRCWASAKPQKTLTPVPKVVGCLIATTTAKTIAMNMEASALF